MLGLGVWIGLIHMVPPLEPQRGLGHIALYRQIAPLERKANARPWRVGRPNPYEGPCVYQTVHEQSGCDEMSTEPSNLG